MTKLLPPVQAPDLGFAPDIDPAGMTRAQLVGEMRRVHRKADLHLRYAQALQDDVQRADALARASSATGTWGVLVPLFADAAVQPSRAARRRASPPHHAEIAKAAEKLPERDRVPVLVQRFSLSERPRGVDSRRHHLPPRERGRARRASAVGQVVKGIVAVQGRRAGREVGRIRQGRARPQARDGVAQGAMYAYPFCCKDTNEIHPLPTTLSSGMTSSLRSLRAGSGTEHCSSAS
jgi:hypothetical protein